MTIWRLNINPEAGDDIDPRKFCIDKRILGVGWQVDKHKPLDWNAYEELGTKEYYDKGDNGWWPAVNAIGNRMECGDLCWTRDWNGAYYIGMITGDWEYRTTKEYRDADIVNVRKCEWCRAGNVDSAPGKVVNSFGLGRTVQAVYDDTVEHYSKALYNQLSKTNTYDLPEAPDYDLWSLIGTDDCEDILGIYLQEVCGYRLIPSTCKRATVKTEFILKHAKKGTAQVQVKQGINININRGDFEYDEENPCDWYLFSTIGEYTGECHERKHCMVPEEMRDFALENPLLMPKRIQTFISLAFPAEAGIHN